MKIPQSTETHRPPNGHQMRSLAESLERYHTQPAPEVTRPAPNIFPPLLQIGLGLGTFMGALLGWLFGWLLLNGTLVIPGWEGIYSLEPVTFYTFWIITGAAAGLLVGGIGTILAAKSPHH